jgi:hypothetical protein
MQNKNSSILLLLAVCVAFWSTASTVRADSYYSSIGLGLPKYYVSQKAVGMGGAGIGVSETLTLNAMNPAANDIRGATSLSVQFEYELVNSENRLGKTTTLSGIPSGLQFVFPIKKSVTFITMISPLTSSSYMLDTEQMSDSTKYTRSINGNGGLSAAALGLQYRFKDLFSVAGLVNFNFGSINEVWRLQFDDAEYTDAKDSYNSHLSGISYDLSLLVKPNRRWSLGLVYRTGCNLSQRTDLKLGTGYSTKNPDGKITWPGAIGAGIAWSIPKMLFAFDFYSQSWSNYKVNGVKRGDFKNSWRLGGGMEYQNSSRPTDHYRRRIAYRVGAYYSQLPFSYNSGNAVDEMFITTGLSLPFSMNNGRVDLAIEAGKRGNQTAFPYQENILRFSISIMGGERWFARR